jgi:hypothetical protein
MLKIFRNREVWYNMGYDDGYKRIPPPRPEYFTSEVDAENYAEGYNDGKIAAALGYVDGENDNG